MIGRTLPGCAGVFFVLVIFVSGSGWAATLLFKSSGAQTTSTEFATLDESIWNLFICLTSANFPDIMMPYYSQSRWTVLFFVPFLVIGHLFLLNLILAVVVKAHGDSQRSLEQSAKQAQRRSLLAAFRALDVHGNGALPRSILDAVFKELNYYQQIAHIGQARAQLLFAALDRSGEGTVDEDEFLALCELLRVRFERIPRRPGLETCAPQMAASAGWQRISSFVRSGALDHAIDVLLIFAGVALVVEQREFLSDGRPEDFDSRPDSLWNILELAFSVVFFLEMMLKIAALGWSEYCRSLKNIFDGFVTAATSVIVALVYFPNSFSDSRLIRCVLLLRLLRLLRLLEWSPHVSFVARTFVFVLPQAHRLGKALFVVLYGFGALGVVCFGGLINSDPLRPEYALLHNSSFGEDNYYADNFNDLASGIVLCGELLIINNWYVLCGGFEVVSGTKWARAFFVAFYAIGVLICLNIAVAFCVDGFLSFMDKERKVQRPADLMQLQDGADTSVPAQPLDDSGPYAEAVIDGAEFAGTSRRVSGFWRAIVATSHAAVLRQLVGPHAIMPSRDTSSEDFGSCAPQSPAAMSPV